MESWFLLKLAEKDSVVLGSSGYFVTVLLICCDNSVELSIMLALQTCLFWFISLCCDFAWFFYFIWDC